jgi:hypothetical protein
VIAACSSMVRPPADAAPAPPKASTWYYYLDRRNADAVHYAVRHRADLGAQHLHLAVEPDLRAAIQLSVARAP